MWEILLGSAIAVTTRSLDPSLITKLIVVRSVAPSYRALSVGAISESRHYNHWDQKLKGWCAGDFYRPT